MAEFERFHFQSLEDFKKKIEELGVDIPVTEDVSSLGKKVPILKKTVPNSLAVLPMEGCDANPDGSPSALTIRRYRRFAEGGAGLLWFEACAVTVEGRANPHQLFLNDQNMASFRELTALCREAAEKRNGYRPVTILQLTHSGRYARPFDNGAPMIPQHDPYLDPRVGITEDYPMVTDEYLDELQEKYVKAALLAKEAGFDGVDIKACHRYLVSELLASHTRKGKYGGSFENRSRFVLEVIRKVKKAVGDDFIVASRFNVYDAHPYPYGFGVSKESEWIPDLEEPLKLVKEMVKAGVSLLSNSAGNPYYRFPQVTRPFDQPILNGEMPQEHPLESVARLMQFTREIQEAAGDVAVIGNGYSWMREYIPYVGAANLQRGGCTMIGLGRQSFAYPDASRDILETGRMDAKKCCIACSKCTQIMRDHGMTGCVVRDSECYLPLYKEARASAGK
ncbi:MAG: NADH:flavin oxidoreductase [Eubacteriales bacterium]|nr:NADH:flavin oxidoreductase [Eubacteriales bacterium]